MQLKILAKGLKNGGVVSDLKSVINIDTTNCV